MYLLNPNTSRKIFHYIVFLMVKKTLKIENKYTNSLYMQSELGNMLDTIVTPNLHVFSSTESKFGVFNGLRDLLLMHSYQY